MIQNPENPIERSQVVLYCAGLCSVHALPVYLAVSDPVHINLLAISLSREYR